MGGGGDFKSLFVEHRVACYINVPNIPNFTNFEEVKKEAATNKGTSIESLKRVSHIHLFGIGLLLFFMGFIFCFAVNVLKMLKILAIAFLFSFLIMSILSCWLTKLKPGFVCLIILSGIGYSLASWFMKVNSMY